ncbi:MAG: cytidine deaminase [Flavobacteriales bacterium]|nr:cytidine deaminase [Flavobacteriales bacterium]
MKRQETRQIEVEIYSSIADLEASDRALMERAIKISKQAYAPYSRFLVGAALVLESGEVVLGTNQENVAYPSGICAERTAFYYAGTHFPHDRIMAVAVTASSKDFKVDYPVSPCGSCRQAMYEYEAKQNEPIRVIMMGESGEVRIMNAIADLLPFTFNETGLKKD